MFLAPRIRSVLVAIAVVCSSALASPARAVPGHPSTATPPPGTGVMTIHGSAQRGETLFATECVRCHGVKGSGTNAAPPLKALVDRRSVAAAIVWIKSPQPPMPKLYPLPLSDRDVNDLVLYLKSLTSGVSHQTRRSARITGIEAGTLLPVKTFDAQAMLADLESSEGTLHDGSVIVAGMAADLLADLFDPFVSLN